MDESNYTKRELDHYFKDITARLEKQDALLISILNQTTKTNGRVFKLEDWRKILVWGFGVLTTVTLFVINKLWK